MKEYNLKPALDGGKRTYIRFNTYQEFLDFIYYLRTLDVCDFDGFEEIYDESNFHKKLLRIFKDEYDDLDWCYVYENQLRSYDYEINIKDLHAYKTIIE